MLCELQSAEQTIAEGNRSKTTSKLLSLLFHSPFRLTRRTLRGEQFPLQKDVRWVILIAIYMEVIV